MHGLGGKGGLLKQIGCIYVLFTFLLGFLNDEREGMWKKWLQELEHKKR